MRSRLNQVLGTKREDNQRVPCLPGLLEEAPNGLCRDLWLDTPLEQLEQMIVDARAKHATGKGKFRTLLIARLDALALAALRPPPVATPAPEEESAPQYPTPQPGQTWVDPKGEAVEIVQVQELKRVEKRRGVEVEVSAGTLIHLSTGRKARLGEFMLSHRPSVQP